MKLPTMMLPPDTYERHHVTARLVRALAPQTVLDVGGARGALARFLKGCSITTVNVDESADTQYDGKCLPFPDSSFDVVTSIDVLEHVPAPDRQAFIAELSRVARTAIVLVAPLGTPLHRELEEQALSVFAGTGGDMERFLREHLENGLPSVAEVAELLSPYEHALCYAGDCVTAFRRTLRGKRLWGMFRRWGALGDVLAILMHANWCRPHRTEREPQPHTNRFYAVCRV